LSAARRAKDFTPQAEDKTVISIAAKAVTAQDAKGNHNGVPPSAKVRTILIVDGYPALLRARRRRKNWDDETKGWYDRHRWRAEGVHGEGKTQHGLRRAVRRGVDNVAIQVYLTAAVMNLKRLAAFLRPYLTAILQILATSETPEPNPTAIIIFPAKRTKKETAITWAT